MIGGEIEFSNVLYAFHKLFTHLHIIQIITLFTSAFTLINGEISLQHSVGKCYIIDA